MINHNQPNLSSESIKDLTDCLKSNNLTTGEIVKKFEIFFSKKYYKSGYSLLVSSGTAALFLAIQALKLKKKKYRILIPTYACSALLNAIYQAGCEPVIADIDYNTFTLSTNKKYNNIDIIIVLNIFGSNPDIVNIKKIYPKSYIILDACHSIGMKINLKSDIFLADIVIHSFYSTKIITSGHGGLIWSKNKKYINFCKDFINFDLKKKYKIRFNYLITDFQASLLFDQIKKIEKIRKTRNQIFLRYKNSISKNLKIFSPYNLSTDIVYRSVLIFNNTIERNLFKKKLFQENIKSIVPIENYELLHNYKKLNKKNYKVAEAVSKKTLSLPMHLFLKRKEIDKICELIKNF